MLDSIVDATGSARPDRDSPAVKRLSSFAPLLPADIAALRNLARDESTVPADTELAQEGDRCGTCFVILDGFACRYQARSDGRQQITAILLPGDFTVTDTSVVDQVRCAIRTLSPCRLVKVDREWLTEIIRQHPRIGEALRLSRLAEDATLRRWVLQLGCGSAQERSAHLLCELFVRLRKVGLASARGFPLPIRQTDLAMTLGLSTVHMNRVIQALRRKGLADVKGRRAIVLDWPGLQAMSEFDPGYLSPSLREPADRDSQIHVMRPSASELPVGPTH